MPAATLLNLSQLEEDLRSHLQANHRYTEGDALSLLAHGEANAIFRLNSDRLIRVAVNTPNQRFGGDFSQVTAFEGSILRYLEGTGEGTGISHHLLEARLEPSEDFPYTYLVTNYIAGEPLNYGRQHLKLCANTLARLHRLPLLSGYEDPVARLVPPLQQVTHPLTLFFKEAQDYAQPYFDFPEANAEIVEMLKSVLLKAQSRLSAETLLTDYPHECLVHSDHTYDNWVVDGQQAFLIDWEWAEVGSPAGDLGHFLSPITICRRQGYRLPAEDKQFFLETYYSALGNAELAQTIKMHFAAFGAFPALRSLCWTAGYWVTARRWYADSAAENTAENNAEKNSAAERMNRLKASQQAFPQMWADVMALLEEPLP